MSGRRFDPAAWRVRAACRGLDAALFYPERGEDLASARAVCAGCPVAADCLAYALANSEQFGVWAGTSAKQRRRLRVESRARQQCALPGCERQVHGRGLCQMHYARYRRHGHPGVAA